jgi:chondroitin-sulfate-ABC endolyase/exolyase
MPLSFLRAQVSAVLICASVAIGSLTAAAAQTDDGVLSFEGKAVPAEIEASTNSTLALSDARYIDGKQSLRWSWNGGPAWLVIHHAITYEPGPKKVSGEPAAYTFAPWIYLRQPMPGTLHFTFGRQGQPKPDCGFEFGLDFSGWRTAWLAFDRDMQGKPAQGMDQVRIETPAGVDQGELFLDSIVLSEVVDARNDYPDRQVPYVNQEAVAAPALEPLYHWLPKLSLLDLAPDPKTSTASAEEMNAVEEVTQRIEKLYLPADRKASSAAVDALMKQFAAYDIEEGPEGLRGRHLSLIDRQIVVYPEDLRDQISKEFIPLQAYQLLMLKIAQAYHAPGISAEDRERLGGAFVMMVRHLLDQGWAEGSNLGTVHHLGYEFREIAPATLLMRDVLAQENLLEPISRAIGWYFNRNIVFKPDAIHSDMDFYNTLAMGQLISILLLPDGPAKAVTLRGFSEMVSRIMADQAPGVENGFKSDGTAFHHSGQYPAYAAGALNNGSKVIRVLADTPFALTPAARENFRHALMTMRLYSNPDWAIGFAGRHPIPNTIVLNTGMSSLDQAFVNLAFSGDPETGEPVDRGVLAAAERIWPALMKEPEIAQQHVAPETTPQGHWTLNYAAAGVHRDGDKTVTLKGYNQDVWSSEIYTHDNRFGRYQSNGSIVILNQGGNRASGFAQAGWDWNHIPGTTSVDLPLDELRSPNDGELMLKSPRAFAGDCNLDGKSGVFAIDLYDQELPGSKGLTARKSAFCFGPRIICLGTDISSPNQQYPTQTTLFQTQLRSPTDPIWLNSPQPVAQFPWTLDTSSGDASVLVDPFGNGYYIPGGQNLTVARMHQHSRDDATERPTEGDFASAWLNHGKAPRSASYCYAIVLGANIDQMLRFAASFKTDSPHYRILRQDTKVHAVLDRATGVTALACFEPVSDLLPVGDLSEPFPVRSVDRPALVMSQPQSDGTLHMSVCDPALHLENGQSKPVQITIRLAGSWSVLSGNDVQIEAAGDQTTLHVRAFQAQPAQFALKPGGGATASK